MGLTKNIDDHLNPVKILEITIKMWYNRVVSIAGLGKMYACDERFKKNIDIKELDPRISASGTRQRRVLRYGNRRRRTFRLIKPTII